MHVGCMHAPGSARAWKVAAGRGKAETLLHACACPQGDALRKFYTSLMQQRPKSEMAKKWWVEGAVRAAGFLTAGWLQGHAGSRAGCRS